MMFDQRDETRNQSFFDQVLKNCSPEDDPNMESVDPFFDGYSTGNNIRSS